MRVFDRYFNEFVIISVGSKIVDSTVEDFSRLTFLLDFQSNISGFGMLYLITAA